MDFSSQFSLPSTVSSTSNSHHLNVVTNVKNIKKNFDVNHHHQSISHPSLNKFQLKWYMWSDYVRDLPGLLLLGILAVHGVVDHQLTRTQCCHIYGKYKNFHVNHHHHCISHPSWRNFQLKWYIIQHCAVPNFWSDTERGSSLVAKWAHFMCSTTLLLGWRLKNKYFGLQTSVYENVENPPNRAFWSYKLKL